MYIVGIKYKIYRDILILCWNSKGVSICYWDSIGILVVENGVLLGKLWLIVDNYYVYYRCCNNECFCRGFVDIVNLGWKELIYS